jgi:flagellar biogenesis protein FliO
MTSTEVRFDDKQTTYQPEHRTKEWATALGTIILAFAITLALIYAFSRFRL